MSPLDRHALDRRSLLRLGGIAVAAASSGCLADSVGEEDTYAEWVPADGSEILFAHLDLGISERTSGEADLLPLILPSRGDADGATYAPQIAGLDEIDDPLLTVPIALGGRVLAATMGFYAAGLGYLVDPEQSESGATDLFFVNGVVGVAGDLDVERAVEQLRTGTEGFVFADPFEKTGEYAAFELYQPTTSDTDAVVAVDGDAALMADTRAELEPAVDAARGEADRAIEERDRFAWLADEAGDGHFTVGWTGAQDLEQFFWGNADEQLPIEFLTDLGATFTSITLDPETGESTAELATTGVGGEAARERLEARLGAASEDVELSIEGDRASATGTYASDVLDVEFRERGDGGEDEGTAVDPEADPPPAVEERVPDDAFRFEHDDSENRVDVHVEQSFEAEQLTVRTIESEWSASVSPVGATNRLTAYVDPEGDTVVVSVTVDGESGVVAAREFP